MWLEAGLTYSLQRFAKRWANRNSNPEGIKRFSLLRPYPHRLWRTIQVPVKNEWGLFPRGKAAGT